ncbi:hypothetical protein GLYMA_20G119000v4 [Glycine max]|nr:hypothetical protein GLYMA_20G119000v4 [Glycine max]|eukprot:XP_025983096.1 LEAF RUST 10 DISEASE-RESISTANCE LOCUS RECEPTOR-LIKE PROTEIN KINASE-like 2.5 isoform X2 [Glycine max]
MSSVYELVLLLLFCGLLPLVLAAGNQAECPPSFPCGYLSNISFPFTLTERPDCGLLPIRNCDDPLKPIMIQLHKNGVWFQLVRVTQHFRSPTTPLTTFHFRDKNLYDLLQNESCEAFRNNYTLPFPHSFHFASFHIHYNTTLFRCNRSLHVSPLTSMYHYTKCPDYDLYYNNNPKAEDASLRACTKALLPIKDVPDANNPFTFVTADISTIVVLTDECAACHYRRGGQCQLDSREIFFCATANSIAGRRSWILKMILGLGLAVTIAALLLVMVKIYHTRWKKQNPTNQQIKIFLEREGPLQTKRYDYSEIKKVTNSFRNKLGQGGFGSVYKGKLPDGRYVAVKILSELKDNGEDFINEVATISRTSHINIVNLLGFCCEGSKRALVYEFMSNGSLEKFIFEENVIKTDRQLDCETIYHIAIGVARGLEYLHQGCNTRILHFDIKPHNILLDENFNPKISDFGLAKICTRKESMISIFGARGTAGYIAPEVFSRNFGAVSHKSDVYSYGMMILEMVGRRKNIKTEVNRSSEIYFPDWIYNCLESNQELGLQNIRNESDDKLVRKMTIVGLWCIQTHPSTRPAISKVLEMLGSKVELLQIPPKPFLSSPPTSPVHLSCETL